METSLAVGNRVSTANGNGTVRFVGTAGFAVGKWVGVELDTPTGKHNGSVQGKSYFTCRNGYGVFVRPVAAKLLDASPRKSVDESSRSLNKVLLSVLRS
jgi:dynactin 1